MPQQKNAQFQALNSDEVGAVSGGIWYTYETTETVAASSDTDGGPSRLVTRTIVERYWIS